MARSIKKGPFIDNHLFKRLKRPTRAAPVRSSKHGLGVLISVRRWSALPLRFIMEKFIPVFVSEKHGWS